MSERQFAVLVNADTDSVGPAANGLEYAIDLDDSGYHVEVYFDGSATQWPPLLEEKPEHPVNKYYEEIQERNLLQGVCGYCADAFGVADENEELGVELLGGREDHGPHVGELVDEGFELITV
ncbi:DsrE family protein [Halegenticoccus soli]|uniref:DsrE family protein n=1 Tax=Halegenticoccus soli TaxID=1985678 RepID=UPI00117B83F6|nr:DsrE family protein [Halegenticoccus soli]